MIFKDIKKFTVKRKNWIRGKGLGNSRMKLENKMCVLGFYALSCGFFGFDIDNIYSPSTIKNNREIYWDTFLIDRRRGTLSNSNICQKIVCLNDQKGISNWKRERELKKLFANHGIKLKFRGWPFFGLWG